MTSVAEQIRLEPVYTIDEIIQKPQGGYSTHFQPTYEQDKLRGAAESLEQVEPVTSPEVIHAALDRLEELANGEIDEPIIVTGRCAEEVTHESAIGSHVLSARRSLEIVSNGLGCTIHFLRAMGQNTKPRSSEHQSLASGEIVPSYLGDAVNSPEKSAIARKADPTRLVAAARQAGLLSRTLAVDSEPVLSAHEALLLPYERRFVERDPETGKKYLLSTVMPWIGKRTNQLDGEHVQLLTGIENPIGIKVGGDSTPEHIAGLYDTLNPDCQAGKLTFMIRIGRDNPEALAGVLQAIAERAPGSLIMYDIHGTTREKDGKKLRVVTDIIEDITMVSDACHEANLTLHGLHLETTTDDSRYECVDNAHEMPRNEGGIDPQLNPLQTERVLKAVALQLLRPTKQQLALRRLESQTRMSGLWGSVVVGMLRDGHL